MEVLAQVAGCGCVGDWKGGVVYITTWLWEELLRGEGWKASV